MWSICDELNKFTCHLLEVRLKKFKHTTVSLTGALIDLVKCMLWSVGHILNNILHLEIEAHYKKCLPAQKQLPLMNWMTSPWNSVQHSPAEPVIKQLRHNKKASTSNINLSLSWHLLLCFVIGEIGLFYLPRVKANITQHITLPESGLCILTFFQVAIFAKRVIVLAASPHREVVPGLLLI